MVDGFAERILENHLVPLYCGATSSSFGSLGLGGSEDCNEILDSCGCLRISWGIYCGYWRRNVDEKP